MNQHYFLFRCAVVFYCEDTATGKQLSLRTKDNAEASISLHTKNEAHRLPVMNLQIAGAYLRHSDPLVASRTWQMAFDDIINTNTGENQIRWQVMAKSKWFDTIRHRLLIETQAEHLLQVLHCDKISINVYLRRMHNFAIGMNWLPASVTPRRQWPAVKFKDKRAITLDENQKIVTAERNPERKALYELCWYLGASQGDIARLNGEDVDWQNSTVSFMRKKTGVPVIVHLGADALNVFKDFSSEGVLFPYMSQVRAGDRATEFDQRCRRLGINGVTLHSYQLRLGGTGKDWWLPGKIRARGFGPQHQGRAPRLCQKGVDEVALTGTIRTGASEERAGNLTPLWHFEFEKKAYCPGNTR